ncbi:MAG TPA: MFS transporter [Candidatus Methylomirabilis sp.]|nr:MFS transporter [Candidatus Methylomirabilis sp.]
MSFQPRRTNPFSSRFWERWGLVAACSGLMTISSGVWYTASVFFVALVGEFGWDYASTASIFALFTVLYGVWGILVGHLVDRFGARRVVLAGGLLLPFAIAANGAAHAQWHLYVSHGVLAALGLSATGYVPVSLVLTRRFREQRGLALGTASAGVGIGMLVLVPLTQAFIDWWGWRIAYLALAAVATLVVLPVGFFALTERKVAPYEVGRPTGALLTADSKVGGSLPEWTLASALWSREFWLVTATFALLNGPTQLVLTHQVAYLVEMGHPKILVAGIVGLVGLFSVPGKIGWGFLSDRWWLELIYLAGASCVVAAILTLLAVVPASSVWSLYAYAVLMGFGYAVSPAMTPILSGRFFAGRHFGLIFGTFTTFHQAAGAAGIWLAGYAHDLTGSYRLPFLGSICSTVLVVVCVWLAAPRRFQPPTPTA